MVFFVCGQLKAGTRIPLGNDALSLTNIYFCTESKPVVLLTPSYIFFYFFPALSWQSKSQRVEIHL